MIRVLDERPIKLLGIILMAGLIGFAIGNGHTTQEALAGSAQWWQQKEHKDLKIGQNAAWAQCMKDFSD